MKQNDQHLNVNYKRLGSYIFKTKFNYGIKHLKLSPYYLKLYILFYSNAKVIYIYLFVT